jgi:predicted phosphohydrolase
MCGAITGWRKSMQAWLYSMLYGRRLLMDVYKLEQLGIARNIRLLMQQLESESITEADVEVIERELRLLYKRADELRREVGRV